MDRLLTVIQRLVIVAVWLLSVGTIVMGLGLSQLKDMVFTLGYFCLRLL